MKFLADENIDFQVVSALRNNGHEVVYIPEIGPGIDDLKVLKIAVDGKMVLITADKDFGEITYRQKKISEGIILLRLNGVHPDKKGIILLSAVKIHGKDMKRSFTVITEKTIRIRKDQ